MKIDGAVDIAATPDEVFAHLTDVARMPDWQSDLVSIEPVDDAPLGVGTAR